MGYIYILVKPLSANSSDDVIHPHRVKGGNDLASHRLYLASYCFLVSLKIEEEKKENFESFKDST